MEQDQLAILSKLDKASYLQQLADASQSLCQQSS